jgi:hypothetical protein
VPGTSASFRSGHRVDGLGRGRSWVRGARSKGNDPIGTTVLTNRGEVGQPMRLLSATPSADDPAGERGHGVKARRKDNRALAAVERPTGVSTRELVLHHRPGRLSGVHEQRSRDRVLYEGEDGAETREYLVREPGMVLVVHGKPPRTEAMYVTLCENCLHWQDPEKGDCHSECVRRGLALPPLMVNVQGRESELCRHAGKRNHASIGRPTQVCLDCGNVVEVLAQA